MREVDLEEALELQSNDDDTYKEENLLLNAEVAKVEDDVAKSFQVDLNLVGNSVFTLGCNVLLVSGIEPLCPSLFADGENLYLDLLGVVLLAMQGGIFYMASLARDRSREVSTLMLPLSWRNLPKELNWNHMGNLTQVLASVTWLIVAFVRLWYSKGGEDNAPAALVSLLELSAAFGYAAVAAFYGWAILDGECARAPRLEESGVVFLRSTVDFYLIATLLLGVASMCTLISVCAAIMNWPQGEGVTWFAGALFRACAGAVYLMSSVQRRDIEMEQPVLDRQRSYFIIETKHR